MDSISKDFGSWVENNRITGVNGDGEQGFYVAVNDLKDYWNEDRVNTVLYQFDIQLPSLIYLSEFTQSGYGDDRLPFSEHIFPNTPEGTEIEAEFLKTQFLFCPAVLKGLHARQLDSRCVLPLTCERQLSGRSGKSSGSATIRLYKLHKASKLEAKMDLVVIKEYPASEMDYSFKNELNAYTSFHTVTEHFLKFYGSFKQNGKGFIILEYAEEGSMLDFFHSNKVPRTREELLDLFDNLLELLDGLRILHAQSAQNHRKSNRQLRGVHQDLKPANIFVCRKEDESACKYKFKVGDFGLSSFNLNGPCQIKNRDNKGGFMYNAPEMTSHDDFSRDLDEGITPLADIWSFGCIFIEAAVWAISDERGREEFRVLRCEENKRENPHLCDQGYEASFHDGKGRLDAIDEILKRIYEQRRVFDDLTERFCKLILDHAMVPVRKPRYEAKELSAVLKTHLENARTTQLWQASPSANAAISREPDDNNPPPFTYPRNSVNSVHRPYNMYTKRPSQSSSQPAQRRSETEMKINGIHSPKDPRSSGNLLGRLDLGIGPGFEQTPLLHSPDSNLSSLDDWVEHMTDLEKGGLKNGDHIESQVPGRLIPTPAHKKADYPKFGVRDVIKWIKSGRNRDDKVYKSLSAAFETLNKRQQIFIIDDTDNMKRDHWVRVIDTFKALAHLTNKVDPDGIELYFRSHPDQPMKPPKLTFNFGRKVGVEKLVEKVESSGRELQGQICYMGISISKILDQVKRKLQQKNSETSIYIYTDGIWDDDTDSGNKCGVDTAILSLVGEMRRLGLTRPYVSIQFIQFGDSEVAKSRLRYLDDELSKDHKEYDIVDTTTDRSAVWKMLLGSVVGTVDNAEDRAESP